MANRRAAAFAGMTETHIMKRIFLILLLSALPSLNALAALDPALVKQLAAEDSDAKIAAIQQLGVSASPDAAKVLKAMSDDELLAKLLELNLASA